MPNSLAPLAGLWRNRAGLVAGVVGVVVTVLTEPAANSSFAVVFGWFACAAGLGVLASSLVAQPEPGLAPAAVARAKARLAGSRAVLLGLCVLGVLARVLG